MIDLAGQVTIVTGAGRGLGRAYAHELARRGALVVVNDVDGVRAELVAGEIEAAGGEAVVSVDSVARPEGAAAIVETALAQGRGLQAVVSNAAVWANADFDEMDPKRLDLVLDVALCGAFFVLRPAWDAMREAGYGRLVLVSSSAGAFGRAGGANYCAAKAGLLGLGRALGLEGEPFGIRTNCVLPVAATQPADPGRRAHAGHRAAVEEAFAGLGGRTGPERVAPLVALLASPECPVNGHAYSVCGGRYARLVSGLTDGWTSPGAEPPTAEELAGRLADIGALRGLVEPASALDEIVLVGASLNHPAHPRSDA